MNASVVPDLKIDLCPSHGRPDIRSAIADLTDADHLRLVSYASAFAMSSRLEADEIYNAAIISALDGSSVWPPDVGLVPFLKMSMRSIASNEAKKANRAPLFPLGGDENGLGDLIETSASVSDEGVGETERLVCSAMDTKALLERVFALFDDDLDAQLVLMARVEDKDAADIKSEMQMNDTRYASIMKKIKRRLTACIDPKGLN